MDHNGKEVNSLFIETERTSRSIGNSRRPSQDSTNSLNVPLSARFDRELTPQINNIIIPRAPDKYRSQSLFNISKFHKHHSMTDNDAPLNGIEESPRDKGNRRGSLPSNQSKPNSTVTVKDAFGPQLSDDTQVQLPGTPLPSLVQENEEFTDGTPPLTPVTKEQVLDPESLYFRDGRRKIDMVLVYEEEELGVMTEAEAKRRDRRKSFQENLIKEGLELELEHKDLSFDGRTWFLKIHLPWKTKTRYAALMGMKLPIKRFITISVKAWDDKKESGKIETFYSKWQKRWREFFEFDHDLINREPSFYDATEGGADREEQFIVKDRVTEYSSAQRSLIVMQILLRVKFDDTDKLLYLEWARPSKWMKRQPLNLVRKYFGDKIGLYFCWLGYYTKMLYAPAVVGTLCFLYGLFTIDGDDNIPTKEICDPMGPGNITLCPMCDKVCKYQKLKESCKFARLTYLFDNPATVFFAIFMSLWDDKMKTRAVTTQNVSVPSYSQHQSSKKFGYAGHEACAIIEPEDDEAFKCEYYADC